MCRLLRCNPKYTRVLLIIANVIFLLTGLLLLGLGIVAQVKPEYILTILGKIPGMPKIPDEFNLGGILSGIAIFIISLGAVVAALGFLGCFGAGYEKRQLLIAYVVVLAVFVLIEVTLVLYVILAPENFNKTIKNMMRKSMDGFKEDAQFQNRIVKFPNNAVSLAWTVLQFEANCCGTNNYTDYTDYRKWTHDVTYNGKTHSAVVPISCCAKKKDTNHGTGSGYNMSTFFNLDACLAGNYTFMNQKNCYDFIADAVNRSRKIAIGIVVFIIGEQSMLISMAIALCRRKDKKDQPKGKCQDLVEWLEKITDCCSDD